VKKLLFGIALMLCFNLSAETFYYLARDKGGNFSCILVTKKMMQDFKKANNYEKCKIYPDSYGLDGTHYIDCDDQQQIRLNLVEDKGTFKNEGIEKIALDGREQDKSHLWDKTGCKKRLRMFSQDIKEEQRKQKRNNDLGL